MGVVGKVFASQRRYERAQRLREARPRARSGGVPVPGWSAMRELPEVPDADVPGVVA